MQEMKETRVGSLGGEDPLEEEISTLTHLPQGRTAGIPTYRNRLGGGSGRRVEEGAMVAVRVAGRVWARVAVGAAAWAWGLRVECGNRRAPPYLGPGRR